jgi:NADH oxidase (H2O2-forming)
MEVARQIIVIGCGTAGAAATLMARKTDRSAEITILQDEAVPEYSRCGLPYTINRVIPNIEDVIIHPVDFYTGKLINADLRLKTQATNVDIKAKEVQVIAENQSTETLKYDALIFATGARPSSPPIEGLDAAHVYRLHTFDDAKQLQKVAKKGKKVGIIGAGLVGLETAEALHSLGLEITIIEYLNSVLPAMIDDDMAKIVSGRMEAEGVKIRLGTAAKMVESDYVLVVDRESETETKIPAEIVVVATGVRANTEIAKEAGINLGPRGGILVDERMQTSVSDVYAAGDCAEHLDLVTKQTIVSGLGSIALRQGEVAGINAAGGQAALSGVVLARTTHLFGLEIAAVGPTRAAAEQNNLPILAGKFKGGITAEYYPTEKEISIKLLANKDTGILLGGQAIGPCAHQRANILSSALMANMTVKQVSQLETCYAPPVAPIREPLTLAAHILALRYDRLKQRK